MKKIFFILFLILILNFVFAQESGIDFIRNKTLKILSNIMRFLFGILMILSSLFLIYLGIKYMTTQSTQKVADVHKSLLYVIIGIVLLITSFFIPNLIKSFIDSLIQ